MTLDTSVSVGTVYEPTRELSLRYNVRPFSAPSDNVSKVNDANESLIAIS